MGRPTKAEQAAKVAYKVPEGEAGSVHIKLTESNQFDTKTGKPIIEPWPQQINTSQDWNKFVVNAPKVGLLITEVLHLPEGFKTKEELEKAEAERLAAIAKKQRK